jgi:murein L,D-transpeptidase YafK
MKSFLHSFFFLLIFSSFSQDQFKSTQLQYSRVKTAYAEKEAAIKKICIEKNIDYASMNVFIRIFKVEKELEVWGRSGPKGKFTLLKTYPICRTSGEPGPKRLMGDGQTPEGFYYIDRFNPQSSYYLSLGINYPNNSDKLLGDKNPGADIFIHGSCVTIGCIPVTDNLIKEIYLFTVEAKDNGQSKIPVHIFPCRFSEEKFTALKNEYKDNSSLISFWENIKTGYDFFEKGNIPPSVTVSSTGKYLFI